MGGAGATAGSEVSRWRSVGGSGGPSEERWSGGPRERREGPDRTELSLTNSGGQRLHPGRARPGHALALAFRAPSGP
jgi:hypothetical protein